MFFKRKFTFVLKSGAKITFYADEIKITSVGNELRSYSIEGGDGTVFYARIDDISAIIKH